MYAMMSAPSSVGQHLSRLVLTHTITTETKVCVYRCADQSASKSPAESVITRPDRCASRSQTRSASPILSRCANRFLGRRRAKSAGMFQEK